MEQSRHERGGYQITPKEVFLSAASLALAGTIAGVLRVRRRFAVRSQQRALQREIERDAQD